MRIYSLREPSTTVVYNVKEQGGEKWFLTRAIVSDMALSRIGRGNEVNFFLTAHLSNVKEGGWILKLHRLYDYAEAYPTEDSWAISALHVHANLKIQNNSGCEGTVLQ